MQQRCQLPSPLPILPNQSICNSSEIQSHSKIISMPLSLLPLLASVQKSCVIHAGTPAGMPASAAKFFFLWLRRQAARGHLDLNPLSRSSPKLTISRKTLTTHSPPLALTPQ
jgi:hypothetical protein